MKEIKQIIEALLFSANEPIPLKKIHEVIQHYHTINRSDVQQALDEMKLEYEQRQTSYSLDEIAGGFQLKTKLEYAPYIEMMHRNIKKEKLSHATCEVLSIIAYKQPVTRAEIDEIRGVDSSGVLSTLLERELIEPCGKKDVPGRPSLYGTTQKFLKHFGLNDLSDLHNKKPLEPASVEEETLVEV